MYGVLMSSEVFFTSVLEVIFTLSASVDHTTRAQVYTPISNGIQRLLAVRLLLLAWHWNNPKCWSRTTGILNVARLS